MSKCRVPEHLPYINKHGCPECSRAYQRRPDVRARQYAWRKTDAGKEVFGRFKKRHPNRVKASHFLAKNPDCTSTRDEVEAIITARLDWLGRPLSGHVRYHLDHIHGGPAVGYVPCQFNFSLSEYVVRHWDEFVEYKSHRDAMEA